jgi:hypothetical protein
MDIRKDFESVATYMHRLEGIGLQFERYDNKNWPHLKNQEDFEKIYLIAQPMRHQFEDLYAKGRDCAIFMSSRLREFNDFGQFPTLAQYVDSFKTTWAYQHVELQKFIDDVRALSTATAQQQIPWAIRQMIEVFDDQLRLLTAVRATMEILQQTNLYKIEKGESPVEKQSGIHIGQITGKVNINSTDNSTNIRADSLSIFGDLRKAIENSAIDVQTQGKLLKDIDAMESDADGPGFLQHYKDFIQNASNHVTVFTSLLPALTNLLK